MHVRSTKIWFSVTLATSIGLAVAGFIVPPIGVIDGSVLTAIGELVGFSALAQVPMLVKKGTDVTVQHGQTSITVNNPDSNED
ncbi:MAG: hypothetical protein K6F72_00130 [Bacteroidales bacterium]|nr:hypothetical protein [Bacteroidales bacterium]